MSDEDPRPDSALFNVLSPLVLPLLPLLLLPTSSLVMGTEVMYLPSTSSES